MRADRYNERYESLHKGDSRRQDNPVQTECSIELLGKSQQKSMMSHMYETEMQFCGGVGRFITERGRRQCPAGRTRRPVTTSSTASPQPSFTNFWVFSTLASYTAQWDYHGGWKKYCSAEKFIVYCQHGQDTPGAPTPAFQRRLRTWGCSDDWHMECTEKSYSRWWDLVIRRTVLVVVVVRWPCIADSCRELKASSLLSRLVAVTEYMALGIFLFLYDSWLGSIDLQLRFSPNFFHKWRTFLSHGGAPQVHTSLFHISAEIFISWRKACIYGIFTC